jgi:hypothetical protein
MSMTSNFNCRLSCIISFRFLICVEDVIKIIICVEISREQARGGCDKNIL